MHDLILLWNVPRVGRFKHGLALCYTVAANFEGSGALVSLVVLSARIGSVLVIVRTNGHIR